MTRLTPTPQHPAPPARQPGERRPGVFVPQHVLAAACCLLAGAVADLLVWLIPAVWPPVGAGIAVTGLAVALYGLWHNRHRR